MNEVIEHLSVDNTGKSYVYGNLGPFEGDMKIRDLPVSTFFRMSHFPRDRLYQIQKFLTLGGLKLSHEKPTRQGRSVDTGLLLNFDYNSWVVIHKLDPAKDFHLIPFIT